MGTTTLLIQIFQERNFWPKWRNPNALWQGKRESVRGCPNSQGNLVFSCLLRITERIQPWSISIQRNTELRITGNYWNMVLIWKIPFIWLGCTRITKTCGYATISGWEQIEPVKHMISPSVNRKCCSPNPQFDFYTHYVLFCPKHMSAHAWVLISTLVLCEQLCSHLLTMKGFELSRCHTLLSACL